MENAVLLQDVKVSVPSPSEGNLEILSLEKLCIATNESVVISGPSGVGKSTTLNVICGLQRVTSGSCTVLGERIDTLSESKRDAFRADKIGVVFQSFNLLPSLTTIENILLAMMIGKKNVDKEKALDLLAQVGLENRANHYPSTLSIGERQRVAVARALAHCPKLIIADEPTGALDRQRAIEVMDILLSAAKMNDCTLIVVTHDLSFTDKFDRHLQLSDLNKAGEAGK